jgi:hypothetical protein
MTDKILNLDEITGNVDSEEVVKSVLATGDFEPTKELGSALPYTRRVLPNDIVPEEYQNKLLAIDYTMTQCFWMIGDICVELINSVNRERSKELGKLVSKTDIYEAIGLYCHRTARSVRFYYECARWFSPEIRAKYDVPFAVFAVARWIDDWEAVLKIASENPIWGADRVRAEFYKLGREPEVLNSEVLSEVLEVHTEQTGKSRSVLLSELDHTLDSLRSVLDRIPLPVSIRVRIGSVLLEIQDIELEIRREI